MLKRVASPDVQGLTIGVAVLVAGLLIGGVFVVLDTSTYDLAGGLIVAPIIIAISLPAFVRQARREGDPRVLKILIIALAVKLLGAAVRYYITFYVYGSADANSYHREGLMISQQLWGGTAFADLSLPGYGSIFEGTPFISLLTGLVYSVIGPTKLGGFMVFSWLAFWGLFLFYRAFVIAVPEGRSRQYAFFLFFIPSLLYWPASLGKDSWMVFGLGIAAFGAARALSGTPLRGLVISALGLWLTAIVRPHIAAMFVLGLAVAFIVQRSPRTRGSLHPIARIVGLAGIVVLAAILLSRTAEFLQVPSLNASGVVGELEAVSERSDYGGSEFDPTIVRSPADLPLALVTVLYRPFPFEANNFLALAVSIEALLLLCLTLGRLRWLWAAVKESRRQPFLILALAYVGIFVVAFSSFPNFGLLVRERVQVLPFLLALLCVPPAPKNDMTRSGPPAARTTDKLLLGRRKIETVREPLAAPPRSMVAEGGASAVRRRE